MNGIEKLEVNFEKIDKDLDNNWVVIFEGIQTILRREAYPNAYEIVKDFINKNKVLNKVIIHDFIDTLDLNIMVKDELKEITPFNYC
jgi:adenylosuccinate lyase